MRENPCADSHKGPTRMLTDARGIPCGKVCDRCEGYRRSMYRPDIFEDPSYWADEPIEPED